MTAEQMDTTPLNSNSVPWTPTIFSVPSPLNATTPWPPVATTTNQFAFQSPLVYAPQQQNPSWITPPVQAPAQPIQLFPQPQPTADPQGYQQYQNELFAFLEMLYHDFVQRYQSQYQQLYARPTVDQHGGITIPVYSTPPPAIIQQPSVYYGSASSIAMDDLKRAILSEQERLEPIPQWRKDFYQMNNGIRKSWSTENLANRSLMQTVPKTSYSNQYMAGRGHSSETYRNCRDTGINNRQYSNSGMFEKHRKYGLQSEGILPNWRRHQPPLIKRLERKHSSRDIWFGTKPYRTNAEKWLASCESVGDNNHWTKQCSKAILEDDEGSRTWRNKTLGPRRRFTGPPLKLYSTDLGPCNLSPLCKPSQSWNATSPNIIARLPHSISSKPRPMESSGSENIRKAFQKANNGNQLPSKTSPVFYSWKPGTATNCSHNTRDDMCFPFPRSQLSPSDATEIENPVTDGFKQYRSRCREVPDGSRNNSPNEAQEDRWSHLEDMASSGRRVSGVKLTKQGHYCIPNIPTLDRQTNQTTGECVIRNFEIGHRTHGKIIFPGYTDVSGLDLDQIVDFGPNALYLYPDGYVRPSYGQGLNRPCQVTLNNASQLDPNCDPGRLQVYLKQYSQDLNVKFLNHCPVRDTWTFMANSLVSSR